jgi:hypothetical protein
MKFAIAILAFSMMAAAGCTQVPPATTFKVNLTWNAAQATSTWPGCTTAQPCVFAVYRAVASGAICPAFSATAWTEITTSATRPSAGAYSDKSAAGLDVCYVVETVQASANSDPSNTYQTIVPAALGSPGGLSGANTAAMAPDLKELAPLPAAKTLASATTAKSSVKIGEQAQNVWLIAAPMGLRAR